MFVAMTVGALARLIVFVAVTAVILVALIIGRSSDTSPPNVVKPPGVELPTSAPNADLAPEAAG